MNFYVNYDRTFGQHSISAMASIERYESFYDSRDIEYADLLMTFLILIWESAVPPSSGRTASQLWLPTIQ